MITNIEEINLPWEKITHCVIFMAQVSPEYCFQNKQESSIVNVITIKKILDVLRSKRIIPVFTSSEFVYAGGKGLYSEDDDASPILIYGKQKKTIEDYIAHNFEKFLIFRVGKMYDTSLVSNTMLS